MGQQLALSTIKTFDVKIDGKSIVAMLSTTEVYQDIFFPAWTANIHLLDSQNILMNLDIRPGKEIVIKMETQFPSPKTKTLTFVVHNVSDRVQIKQSVQGYILSMVDEAFFNDKKSRVSRSYKSTNIGGIADNICNEYGLGSIKENDVSSPNYDIIVPNMSPMSAISWLSKFAVVKGIADVVFFQCDPGKFKLKSLEKMFTEKTGTKFKQFYPNVFDAGKNTAMEDFLSIEHYEFISNHDAISNFGTGYYASKHINYDFMTKKWDNHTFNFGDDIGADKSLKDFTGSYFSGAEKSSIGFRSTSKFATDGTPVADDWKDYSGSRKSSIKKFDANRLVMVVPGNVLHFDLLGKEVEIKLPSNQDEVDGILKDKYLKGSYVVIAIKHTMKTDSYRCVMECGKKRMKQAYG